MSLTPLTPRRPRRAPLGAVHGRFQGLHRGHTQYLHAAVERTEQILIGITNPDPVNTIAHPTDVQRTLPEHNPFTFWERLRMVEACLEERGIDRDRYRILPMPIEDPVHIPNYIPREAMQCMTIYDDWGRQKYTALTQLGYDVDVMWEATDEDRITSGTELRRRMRSGENWRELVTPAVASVIVSLQLVEKLRDGRVPAPALPIFKRTSQGG